MILNQTPAPCEALLRAAAAIRHEPSVTMLTVRDGSGAITRMEAIVK